MPFVRSPHNSKTLFAASNRVFKLDMSVADTLREWMPMSPDLTKGDSILGGRYPAVTAIAQSALDSLRFYAGTQDGNLWTSPDGGANWTEIGGTNPDHFVTSITASTMDPSGVFVTYSGYRNNDHMPYIYYSDDAGNNWSSVGDNIPMMGVNSFLILPDWNDQVLFAGTDGGVYVSSDGGFEWDRLGSNFPYMPVYDLEYNPVMNEIVAATFSRGLMTFPVEELDLVSSVKNEHDKVAEIIVYPTIVNDQIYIEFKNQLSVETHIVRIFNASGSMVFEKNVEYDDVMDVNLPDLVNGLYFVKFFTGRTSKTIGKFIKI